VRKYSLYFGFISNDAIAGEKIPSITTKYVCVYIYDIPDYNMFRPKHVVIRCVTYIIKRS
jgi:hypothetical protein